MNVESPAVLGTRPYYGAQPGAASERAMPEGERIIQDFSCRIDEASKLLFRLRSFADRLTGGIPTVASKATGSDFALSAAPPLNSRLRGVNDELMVLYAALSDELGRLENFV